MNYKSTAFPDKKYDVIVVDPPWQIKKINRRSRPNQKSMDYDVMELSDIKSLPIKSLAKDNSLIFMWTIQKCLFNAKNIIEDWGFKYLCMGVWEKTYGKSAGMPLYGFQWNAEFIAIGYTGKIDTFPKRKLIPLCFSAENVRHSQKPDKFYDFLERLGDERIDLFARRKRNGWDVWGDEISNDELAI